jgi:hypothetical protein
MLMKNKDSNLPFRNGKKAQDLSSLTSQVSNLNSSLAELASKKKITFSGNGKFAKIKIKPTVTSEVVNGNLTGLTYSVRDYYEEYTVSTLSWTVQKLQVSTGKIFEYIAVPDNTQIPSTLTSGVYLRGKTSRVEFEVASVDKANPDGVGTGRIYLFEAVNREKGGNILSKNASNVLTEELQRKFDLGYANKYILDFGTTAVLSTFANNRKLTQTNGKSARIDSISTFTDKDSVVHNIVFVDSFSTWQDFPSYDQKPTPLDDNQNVEIKTYVVSSATFGAFNKCENINFENIIFDGCNYDYGLKYVDGNSWCLLYLYGVKNISIKNCTFKNSMLGGLQLSYAGNANSAYRDLPVNINIDNCYFENNGRGDIEIIRGKNISITNCWGDGTLDIETNSADILEGISIHGCNFKSFTPLSPSDRTAPNKITVSNSLFQTVISQIGGIFKMTNCFIHGLQVYDGTSSTFTNCSVNRFITSSGKCAATFYNSDIYDLPRTNSGSQNVGTLDVLDFVGCKIDLSLVADMTNNTFALYLNSSALKSLTRSVKITRTLCPVNKFRNTVIENIEFVGGNGNAGYKLYNCELLLKDTTVLTQAFSSDSTILELYNCYIQALIATRICNTKIYNCVLDGVSKPTLYSRDGMTIDGLKSTLPNGIDWGWAKTTLQPALLKFNNVSLSKNVPTNLGIINGGATINVSNLAEGSTAFYIDDTTRHSVVLYNNSGAIGFKYVNYA